MAILLAAACQISAAMCAHAGANKVISTRKVFRSLNAILQSDHTLRAQISPTDKISIKGLTDFQPGKQLTVVAKKDDGSTVDIPVNQTFNENQITWFKHGSALNAMAANKA